MSRLTSLTTGNEQHWRTEFDPGMSKVYGSEPKPSERGIRALILSRLPVAQRLGQGRRFAKRKVTTASGDQRYYPQHGRLAFHTAPVRAWAADGAGSAIALADVRDTDDRAGGVRPCDWRLVPATAEQQASGGA